MESRKEWASRVHVVWRDGLWVTEPASAERRRADRFFYLAAMLLTTFVAAVAGGIVASGWVFR